MTAAMKADIRIMVTSASERSVGLHPDVDESKKPAIMDVVELVEPPNDLTPDVYSLEMSRLRVFEADGAKQRSTEETCKLFSCPFYHRIFTRSAPEPVGSHL